MFLAIAVFSATMAVPVWGRRGLGHCGSGAGRLRCRRGGVDDGTRTHDDQIHNLGLYQLSYAHHGCYSAVPGSPAIGARRPILLKPMARLAGLEPATTGLEGRCSIRLSYRRIDWIRLGKRRLL